MLPNVSPKLLWDVLLAGLLAYDAVMVPFEALVLVAVLLAHCGGGSSGGQCFRIGRCASHCSRRAADTCRSDAPCTRLRLRVS